MTGSAACELAAAGANDTAYFVDSELRRSARAAAWFAPRRAAGFRHEFEGLVRTVTATLAGVTTALA